MPTTERINVKIPPGVDTGSKIRVAGKGEAGRHGGPPGDLYILTKVRPHPLYERKGDNLYIDVPIAVTEAALGASIEVQTLDGPVMMKIPPATQSGQTFPPLRQRDASPERGRPRGSVCASQDRLAEESG